MTITSYVTPLAAGSVAARRSGDLFVGLRRELDELQRQLTTGKKAQSYGGLGFDRGTSLDFRAKIAALGSYDAAIQSAELRTTMITKGLEQLQSAASDVKSALLPPKFDIDLDGRTTAQKEAEQRLQLAVDVLNSDIAGRYLFSGRAQDTQPVESADRILNGDATHKGLKQYIVDRKAVDAGSPASGHVLVASATDTVTLSEDGSGFGFGLLKATPSDPAIVVTGPGPSPASFSIQLPAAIPDGTTISFDLRLPDGTTQTVTLAAKATAPLAANEFQSDPDPTVSATNLSAKLGTVLAAQTQGPEFQAASAVRAGQDFFLGTSAAPPPPLVGTTPVIAWYKGDGSPSVSAASARATAPIRVDDGQTVGTGAQANESGIRSVVAGFAVLAAEGYADTPADKDRYSSLAQRVRANLADPPAKIEDMAVDFGAAMATMEAAKQRHQATKAVLDDTVANIETVTPEEVAASILALQTRLQASYQTTSVLSKLSLVNFL
jgi:flagellar hook-associated protein 3 FlgL